MKKQTVSLLVLIMSYIFLLYGVMYQQLYLGIISAVLILIGIWLFEKTEKHNEWRFERMQSKILCLYKDFDDLDCKLGTCKRRLYDCETNAKNQTVKSQVIAPKHWIEEQKGVSKNESTD